MRIQAIVPPSESWVMVYNGTLPTCVVAPVLSNSIITFRVLVCARALNLGGAVLEDGGVLL